MELILLTVPACQNAAVFEERLAAVLVGHPDVVVHRREVSDEQTAVQAGMHGSPTLLSMGQTRSPRQVRHQACPAGCTGTRQAALPRHHQRRRSGRRWPRPG